MSKITDSTGYTEESTTSREGWTGRSWKRLRKKVSGGLIIAALGTLLGAALVVTVILGYKSKYQHSQQNLSTVEIGYAKLRNQLSGLGQVPLSPSLPALLGPAGVSEGAPPTLRFTFQFPASPGAPNGFTIHATCQDPSGAGDYTCPNTETGK